jgi:hypothetical protein
MVTGRHSDVALLNHLIERDRPFEADAEEPVEPVAGTSQTPLRCPVPSGLGPQ